MSYLVDIGRHPTPEYNRYMIIRYDFSKMVMAEEYTGISVKLQ